MNEVSNGDFLVEVEVLVPDDLPEAYRAERDVKLLGSRVNRLYIRRPRCSEVADVDTESTETRRVDLTFGVVPDPDCRITWIRFSVELTAATSERGEVPAIVTDLAPHERFTHFKKTRTEAIKPRVKAGIGAIEAEHRESTETTAEEPQIMGYGIGSPTALWDFTSTNVRPLVGDQHTTIIVQRPRGAVLFAHFGLEARIKTRLGNMIPLAKKTDEPLRATFRIC